MDYLNSNNYLLNIVPLFNVADNNAGLTVDTFALAADFSNAQEMVDYTTKSVFTNTLAPFTTGSAVSLQGDFQVTGSFSVNGNVLGNVSGTTVLSNTGVELVCGTNSLVLSENTTAATNALTLSVNSQPAVYVTGAGQVSVGGRLATPSTLVDVLGDMYVQELFVSSFIYCTQLFETSDERRKTDVRGIDGSALDRVCALRGVEYLMGGRPSLGLLAQEVQRVVPSAVIDNNGTLSVNYSQMIPLLIEAIKELAKRV